MMIGCLILLRSLCVCLRESWLVLFLLLVMMSEICCSVLFVGCLLWVSYMSVLRREVVFVVG